MFSIVEVTPTRRADGQVLTGTATSNGYNYWGVTLSLDGGIYNLSAQASDRCGNPGFVAGVAPASIDTSPPQIDCVTTDTLAGLFSLAFPEATAAGATYGLGGATAATQPHSYAFDTNDTFSATLAVTATDRAGNQTTQPFTLFKDSISPTVTIAAPPVVALHFRVSWSGQDGESGLRDYEVQFKVGTGGTWTSWLAHTPQTEAPFVGERDQSYYFRVQATD